MKPFYCPSCHVKIAHPGTTARGLSTDCPKCGTAIIIPHRSKWRDALNYILLIPGVVIVFNIAGCFMSKH